ncbi:MAG: hypothetical protein Q9178_003416 [Gyalolechia marmorata]
MASTFGLSIRRTLLQPYICTTILPPTFLLPLRARFSTISNTTDPEPQPQDFHPISSQPPLSKLHQAPPPQSPQLLSTQEQPTPQPPSADTTPTQSLLSHTLQPASPSQPNTIPTLLPLLAAQPPHYITAHIHARPYLLTAGDTLRLPFLMPRAPLGTILRLNRASMLGSRDYTLRGDVAGKGYINEDWFVCRARVVGVETEPLRVVEKTKRRQRRVKRVKSKMRFTVLRVVDVRVRVPGVEEEEEAKLEAEEEVKLEVEGKSKSKGSED